MRLIYLLSVLLFFSFSLNAQNDVPDPVKEAFNTKFANAKSVDWDYEEVDLEYEAAFKMDRKRMTAKYDPQGHWLETEYEISESKLPAAVKMALKMEFADYEIDGVEFISTPERSEAYELTLEGEKETLKVVFTAGGKVLQREVEEEE